MNAVGRLGSYITRGVSTVSGPFHPFGGAVDIIVVEQPDGSFKSSPWYVRFGKFQGVLKAREKVVNISVNGIDANFHMYLDPRGEAYFLREVERDEGESVSSSSSDDTDEQSQNSRRPMKSKSFDFDVNKLNSVDQIDATNGKIVARTNSRRSRIFGLVFGRRSMKEDSYGDGSNSNSISDDDGVVRINSMERAEFAANLLDVQWSTNLATSKSKRDNASRLSASITSDGKGEGDKLTNDGQSQVGSSVQDATETQVEHFTLTEEIDSYNVQMSNSSYTAFENREFSVEEGGVEVSNLGAAEQIVQTFIVDESAMEEKLQEISEISRNTDEPSLQDANQDGSEGAVSKTLCPDSKIVDIFEAFPNKKFNEEWHSGERTVPLGGFGISEEEIASDRIQSFIYCEKSENLMVGFEGLKEQSEETLPTNGGPTEVYCSAETLLVATELLPEGTVAQQCEEMKLETVHTESYDNFLQQTNPSPPSDVVNLEVQCCTQMVSVEPILGNEAEFKSNSPISSFINSDYQIQHQIDIGDKIMRNELQPALESVGGSEQLNGDCDLTKAHSVPVSESSEEEQFHFSDLEDFKHREIQAESKFSDGVNKENQDTYEVNDRFLEGNNKSLSSQDCLVEKNQLADIKNSIGNSKAASSPICIAKLDSTTGVEIGRLSKSLPSNQSCINSLGTEDSRHTFSHSLDSDSKSVDRKLHSKDESLCVYSVANNENQSSLEYSNKEDFHHSEDTYGVVNPGVEISLCKHLLYEGMGSEAASQAFDAEKLDIDKFASLGPEAVKNERLVVRIGGHYFPWDAAAPIVLGMVAFGNEIIFEPKGKIPVDQVEKSLVGDPSKAIVNVGGSWRLWPFSFRRSRSRKTMQPTVSDTRSSGAENVSDSNIGTDSDKKEVKPRVLKKMMRAITPTSEELASLNLKEGSNVVTFTFSTAMLGRQKVDARIYLWKWNTRIVISDVDGTITKSDVLGQFMPLVGMDWSQTGVAPLFSAIKKNGYQLLFLSARAISQAYHTRQFLVNLKQNGTALPDGPVVISPDGLFPSLFREVIRRAPHEFKIACLEDIKALFPPDCNPFYAGFGNRDTDEISYLKVGIPKGKIFIINPKGEVAVNRRVDTKSYTSIHSLVHGMFPAMTSSEQEDFNSWNYWRLPPPVMDL
ncbi:phosphatidate phosphatase PAH2 [Jatropha curcas]|uniref:phosphatidate phosphatase PAH2 n=1 Tax=Jatropha curcas TaxID=180498 RepID=UPI0005FAF740|nr:phosphatidate phosphatase PAH2 [Jatropha curcas]